MKYGAASLGDTRPQVDEGHVKAAQASALASYEALWRRRFSRRLRVAATFAHVAMRPGLAQAVWPLMQRWPGVLTQGARLSGKTRCAPEAARLVAAAA